MFLQNFKHAANVFIFVWVGFVYKCLGDWDRITKRMSIYCKNEVEGGHTFCVRGKMSPRIMGIVWLI